MSMPRPGGKPLEIARRVLPNLAVPSSHSEKEPSVEVLSSYEEKIMNINDNQGRNPHEKTQKGRISRPFA